MAGKHVGNAAYTDALTHKSSHPGNIENKCFADGYNGLIRPPVTDPVGRAAYDAGAAATLANEVTRGTGAAYAVQQGTFAADQWLDITSFSDPGNVGITIAFWFNLDNVVGSDTLIESIPLAYFQVRSVSATSADATVTQSTGTQRSTNEVLVLPASTDLFCLMSAKGTPVAGNDTDITMRIIGPAALDENTNRDNNAAGLQFSSVTGWRVGNNNAGTFPFSGTMGNIWVNLGEYHDVTAEATIQKFLGSGWTTGSAPTAFDPGTNGSNWGDSAPEYFLGNAAFSSTIAASGTVANAGSVSANWTNNGGSSITPA